MCFSVCFLHSRIPPSRLALFASSPVVVEEEVDHHSETQFFESTIDWLEAMKIRENDEDVLDVLSPFQCSTAFGRFLLL